MNPELFMFTPWVMVAFFILCGMVTLWSARILRNYQTLRIVCVGLILSVFFAWVAWRLCSGDFTLRLLSPAIMPIGVVILRLHYAWLDKPRKFVHRRDLGFNS